MADFLLEIFSEEIPARMQKNAQENFKKIAIEQLQKSHLEFDETKLECFITPLRMILTISDLKNTQQTKSQKKIGPKISANPKAIEGFLKSNNLTKVEQLQIQEDYYCFQSLAQEIATQNILQNALLVILQKMQNSWHKSMIWDVEHQVFQPRWIRPIRNLLCLFNDDILDIEFAGLKSNSQTFLGLDFVKAINIKNKQHYFENLKSNFLLFDSNQRKEIIIKQIKDVKLKHNIEIVQNVEDSNLLDEIVGLCEKPMVLMGSFDKKFLELPDEVIILTLQNNQKFFCCRNHDGSLSNIFMFVINKNYPQIESNLDKIIADNERLVKARLSDAEFFINEDLKQNLESRIDNLKKIIFQSELGSLFDKSQRVKNLAKILAVFVPHCEISLIDRTCELLKTDLSTKAVAELPELQGKIGSFYALKQKEDNKIAMAIYEQYLPTGNFDIPQTALGISIALADKIDNLVGFFLVNEKPTSSKDPFALRRAVVGILKIAIKYDLALPIRVLIEKSLNNFPPKLLKKYLIQEDLNFYEARKKLIEEIVFFVIERMRSYLRDSDQIRSDVLNVVIDEYLSDFDAHKFVDIIYLRKKIIFLNKFVNDHSNQNIIELYKRSANILAIEEKKDNCKYDSKPSILGLKTKYEKILYRRIKQVNKEFKKMMISAEFEKALSLLHILDVPLKNFFDNVVVNDQDKGLRSNRLLLLSRLRLLFLQFGDLSKINISK